MEARKYWFMNIRDKVFTGDISRDGVERVCPPHYIPHKLPFGKRVEDEPCHFHESSIRTLHHNALCRLIGCPNYLEMKFARKSFLKSVERSLR